MYSTARSEKNKSATKVKSIFPPTVNPNNFLTLHNLLQIIFLPSSNSFRTSARAQKKKADDIPSQNSPA